MREETFLALLDILPIVGSAETGYRVSDRVDSVVMALPEEWATAAFMVLEDYYKALNESNGDDPRRTP